jgi:hypothetical protein
MSYNRSSYRDPPRLRSISPKARKTRTVGTKARCCRAGQLMFSGNRT